MNIKLVASDIDGTITDKNNHIASENYEAVNKLHSKNIDFVICTGKSYSLSKNICSAFNAEYGVFINGAQIINLKTGKELNRKVLEKSEIDYCIKLARSKNLHIHFYTENSIVTENLQYMDLRNYIIKQTNSSELKFFIVPNLEKFIEKENPSIFSLVITSPDSISEIEENITTNLQVSTNVISKKGKYIDTIINKEYEYINITPKNIDKNQALIFLSKYLNIPQTQMLAIGDNINDIEMVKNSGVGIAIGDGYSELKKVANYVTTKTASAGGFAEAIGKYIE